MCSLKIFNKENDYIFAKVDNSSIVLKETNCEYDTFIDDNISYESYLFVFVDVFVDKKNFSIKEIQRITKAVKQYYQHSKDYEVPVDITFKEHSFIAQSNIGA